MNEESADVVERFLHADIAERLDMVQADAGALHTWLGDAAVADYKRLASRLDRHHLRPDAAKNLIFLPGVMGSLLHSNYYGGIWWIDVRSRTRINDLRLAPDGLHDAVQHHDIVPFGIDMSYDGFFAAVLQEAEFGHVNFPYDWRKPIQSCAEPLHDKIEALHSASGQPVHLVAHSMGGLVARAALMTYPKLWKQVGKVVFLGTPHYGAPAIAGYLKNHLWGFDMYALLGRYLDRQTFRSLRGVLNLLPAPAGVYPGTRKDNVARAKEYPHPCANFDLYDSRAWRLDLPAEEEHQLQEALDTSAEFHQSLHAWHTTLDQSYRDRMAVIAGVGYRALFRLAYQRRLGFLWEHMDRVTGRIPESSDYESDGRVPLASARLEHIGETRYVRAKHGSLPTVPSVCADVFRFLSDQPMQLASTPAAALTDSTIPLGQESVTPALADTGQTPTPDASDDPGYLSFDQPDITPLEELLMAEQLPQFTRVRIL